MTYENFLKLTLGIKKTLENSHKLQDIGIDLIDYDDSFHKIISALLDEIYTEEGIEWLDWFMYESDFGQKDWSLKPSYENIDGIMVKTHEAGEVRYGATDENGNPICYSFESTWEYLKQYEKRK
jgi:hypothetical protein